jgi:hypothetical protein
MENNNKKTVRQHTSYAICEFSGIIVFYSYFRLAENTRLRKLKKSRSAERWWQATSMTRKDNRKLLEMDFNNRKSYLELNVIWKDDDMFELRVFASNGRYSGITEVYETSESLEVFANLLFGFPKDNSTLFHEMGTKNSYAYFSMKYYSIDNTGKLGVELNLEENVATEFRNEEKDKLKLEIIVEQSSIDNFQKELKQLAINQEGKATLFGRNN